MHILGALSNNVKALTPHCKFSYCSSPSFSIKGRQKLHLWWPCGASDWKRHRKPMQWIVICAGNIKLEPEFNCEVVHFKLIHNSQEMKSNGSETSTREVAEETDNNRLLFRCFVALLSHYSAPSTAAKEGKTFFFGQLSSRHSVTNNTRHDSE